MPGKQALTDDGSPCEESQKSHSILDLLLTYGDL
jgi:hypothetical protein